MAAALGGGGARPCIGRRVDRVPEPVGGGRIADAHGDRAQLEQHLAPDLLRGRLREHAAHVPCRGLRCAACDGIASRGAQPLHHPAVAARLGEQEMGSDAVGLAPALGEQAGGPRVRACSLSGRELVVDRGPHDRMDEAKRPRRSKDLGPNERVRHARSALHVEVGERGRVAQLGARPSTATARASAAEPRGRRARRSTSALATVLGPRLSTRAAASGVGATPSAASASASWPTRNGLPPVAV
jgi:hypothetical protein